MTILDSILAISTYPIPNNRIEKICIVRELDSSATFTKTIGDSQLYQLAIADTYMFLYTAPSIREQEISLTVEDRNNYLSIANGIYNLFGVTNPIANSRVGFIGEDYNG